MKNDFKDFDYKLNVVLQKEADDCKELVRKFIEESQPIKDNLIKIFPVPLQLELFVHLAFSGSVVPPNSVTSFTGQNVFEERIETFKDNKVKELFEIARQKSGKEIALLSSLVVHSEINVEGLMWISRNGFSVGPMYNTADDLKRNGFYPIVLRPPSRSTSIRDRPPFVLSSGTQLEDILMSDNTHMINVISDLILRQP